ncbi:MAG: hypothetical protein K9W44_12540 [Candidatus Lokiarchaeota archaeon]|nr:hypothetical protein [Candidatus Harpocratesius repetitus]
MIVDIDFETICVNCKEKGYSFGYTLKSILYNGKFILDLPQRYLNGSCLFFSYLGTNFFIRSLENSHALGAKSETPIFSMINAKHNQSSTLSRFTYLYSLHNHPEIQKRNTINNFKEQQIYEYVDMYRFPSEPYLFLFYSFRNGTDHSLNNFNFYQYYDFDIYGQDFFDTDKVGYNSNLGYIYQYDSRFSIEESIFAGIGSVLKKIPNHFEGNSPDSIFISPKRLDLRDNLNKEIGDQAVSLQWKVPSILPGQIEVFPVAIVLGKGEAEFLQNIKKAQKHMQKLISSVIKAINIDSRQEIDPKLEKMSFSMKEWCKN